MSHNKEIGGRGEQIAVEYITSIGMVVVDRNWNSRKGEIDIIALDGVTLRMIEVKTRMQHSDNTVMASLGAAKLKSIERAAVDYISKNRVNGIEDIYFDLIVVIFAEDSSYEIEYTPCFFYPQW